MAPTLRGLGCRGREGSGSISERDAGAEELADAYERMLLVQMETVTRRQLAGSGTWSLDAMQRAMDVTPPDAWMASRVRGLFAALRQRLSVSGARGGDDPSLAAA